MRWLDKSAERTARNIAQRTSRRGFFGTFAGAVVGAATAVPLLPVAKAQENSAPTEEGDSNCLTLSDRSTTISAGER